MITEIELASLLQAGTEESKTLEYKVDAYGFSDDGRREFLKDVTAMANTAGGLLLLGVEEERDDSGRPTGRPSEIVGVAMPNWDDWKLRVSNMLRDACDPPLNGVELFQLGTFANGPVVGVRVPKSWTAPHRVKVKDQSYFYLRTSAGNGPMDSREIRQAFLLSESVGQRMSEFRSHRVGLVATDEGPVPLRYPIRCVCHILPVSSFTGEANVDLKVFFDNRHLLRLFDAQPTRPRLNFNGVIGYDEPRDDLFQGWTQVFRDGRLESATAFYKKEDEPARIPGFLWERGLTGFVYSGLKMLDELGVGFPAFVAVSLIGVATTYFSEQSYGGAHPIRENVLLLPEVEFEAMPETAFEVRTRLTPAIDTAWQSAGWLQSHYQTEGGFRLDLRFPN